MPLVAVPAADAVQVRAGALASPLERMVVDELAGHRVVAVAQRLRLQGPDHLRVAVVATLAHVDVAARELQRRVGLEALDRLARRALEEERNDLDDAADGDDEEDEDDEEEIAGLDLLVTGGGLGCAHGRSGF